MSSNSTFTVVVAAVACLQLASSSTFALLRDTFFSLNVRDQMALVCLATAFVWSATAVSDFARGYDDHDDDDDGDHDHDKPPLRYPLEELRAAVTDRRKSARVYADVVRDSVATLLSDEYGMPPDVVVWALGTMDRACGCDDDGPSGTIVGDRGATVLAVARAFAAPRPLDATEEARACVLGWAAELSRCSSSIADDDALADGGNETRRDELRRRALPEAGSTVAAVVNDSVALSSLVSFLLREHFRRETYYVRLTELFAEATRRTVAGRSLDRLTTRAWPSLESANATDAATAVDFDRFTRERYETAVEYKISFCSFYLPVAVGMTVNGVWNEHSHAIAKRICALMGEYVQVQEDFLDCYRTTEIIGKIGTDIQNAECTWLIVRALRDATPAQRKILEENYGQWDDAKVAKIKAVYDEMNLRSAFETYEENSYQQFQEQLQRVTFMPHEVFTLLWDKIYKKSKS